MARKASSVTKPLSTKQEEFVNQVMLGATPHAAAGVAYSDPSAAGQIMRSATVKNEIARAREEISNLTTLKRVDVIEGIMDGIEVARMMSDGGNVIRGWTEIAKILGHYAPEVKTINLNIGQQRMRSKLEALSDEELMALSQARVVEGEVVG